MRLVVAGPVVRERDLELTEGIAFSARVGMGASARPLPLSALDKGSEGNPTDFAWTVARAFREVDFFVGETVEVCVKADVVEGEGLCVWDRVDLAGESV